MSDIVLPKVAIVGRPNVGKSSLLNKIAGRRISIVDPRPGVTRDRVSTTVEWKRISFELIDTGGIGIVDEKDLTGQIQNQIEIALTSADLILFLVDAKDGLTRLDREVAEKLRKLNRPLLLVANKAEGRLAESESAEFYSLGLGEMHLVSAKTGHGLDDLFDRVVKRLREIDRLIKPQKKSKEEKVVHLAIVGRRNAGKSSLVNALAGEPRVIVSEIPGTTRDAIDVRIEKRGFPPLIVIDTAGVKKKSSIQDSVEYFSLDRAERAIRRSDVALLLFDCTTDISDVDKKLARFVVDHHKPCVIVVSKWDLSKAEPEAFRKYIQAKWHGLHFAPIAFLSSKDENNLWETIELALDLYKQAGERVGTGDLNRVLNAARDARLPSVGGNLPKIFYGTQVGVHPPEIVLFVNEPKYFKREYDRFLQNRLREELPYSEVPIRILYRKREKVLLSERKS